MFQIYWAVSIVSSDPFQTSSRNAVSFSSARTMKRFPSPRGVRLQSRSFARWNPRLAEIAQVHGCFSSQSFWKAGSPRKGSQIGSSRKNAGVSGIGLQSELP